MRISWRASRLSGRGRRRAGSNTTARYSGSPTPWGACVFLTGLDGLIVGFASWDPRQRPRYGIVGHNCILPEFQGRGFGREQIQEVLRRFRGLGIQTARATTCDHPFFAPAHRMYQACGFREVRRMPWDRDPGRIVTGYEKQIG